MSVLEILQEIPKTAGSLASHSRCRPRATQVTHPVHIFKPDLGNVHRRRRGLANRPSSASPLRTFMGGKLIIGMSAGDHCSNELQPEVSTAAAGVARRGRKSTPSTCSKLTRERDYRSTRAEILTYRARLTNGLTLHGSNGKIWLRAQLEPSSTSFGIMLSLQVRPWPSFRVLVCIFECTC